jgi:alanine racemase
MPAPGATLTIDLGAIAANYRLLAGRAPGADCAAVVKADAYGLGAAEVAPALWAAGARRFFVAQAGEGVALRAILPDAEIGILNGLSPGEAGEYAAHGLVPVLNDLGQIAEWQAAARAAQRPLPAILQTDTGMARLGMEPREHAILAAEPERLEGLELKLVMSHLACADTPGHPMTAEQIALFTAHCAALPPAPRSLANSAGVLLGPECHFEVLRPGVAIYGGNPIPECPSPLAPCVRLAGKILQLRQIDRHRSVGYGATYRAPDTARLATIAVGYADGYLRAAGNQASAYWRDIRLPLVGRVSMDLITLDISAVPEGALGPGDTVDLLGPHYGVDELARDAGTIPYEILTDLGPRYARRYRQAEIRAA